MKKIVFFLIMAASLSACSETIYLEKIGSAGADYTQVAEKSLDWSIACPIFVLLFVAISYFAVVRPHLRREAEKKEQEDMA